MIMNYRHTYLIHLILMDYVIYIKKKIINKFSVFSCLYFTNFIQKYMFLKT